MKRIVWRKTPREYWQLLEEHWDSKRNLDDIRHNLIYDKGITGDIRHLLFEAYMSRTRRLSEIEWEES